jgi:outer membrane receptor protein involved in Fe transport
LKDIYFLKIITATAFFIVFSFTLNAQENTVKGKVIDQETGEDLIGASVVIKGTTTGAVTDIDGNFEFKTNKIPPFTIVVSFIGYLNYQFEVIDLDENVKIKLSTDQVMMDEVQIVGSRIREKEQLSALTTESMDVLAIKEAASGNFYESLGNLKGVDVTSASLGFKVINTRGFNSTSPVRSLQLIDGVDNQSPGLNFSLGNFLGASDLDVMNVEIVSGASSAFFGPGAFNGVINMTTKSPWLFPGLSAEIKVGERQLFQGAVRWAQVIKNKEGIDKFAYKISILGMRANDWVADNLDPSTTSETDQYNFAGYDAVNVYGDEVLTGGNNYAQNPIQYPGLGIIYRTGYLEGDVMDYDTENLKTNLGLYYMINPKIELKYAFNFSTGTTVYQGDNRYSLKNIKFFQHNLEVSQADKFFVRYYATHEDAGDSYDAVVTAFEMSSTSKPEGSFYRDYADYYNNNVVPQMYDAGMPSNEENRPNLATIIADCNCTFDEALQIFAQQNVIWRNETVEIQDYWINENTDQMREWHADARSAAENIVASQGQYPFFQPGTQRFDSLLSDVTSRYFNEGGSRLYDKSALQNVDAQYLFTLYEKFKFTSGANFRLYTPDSQGTIFEDTSSTKITNWNVGAYLGLNYTFLNERLILDGTIRVDKNENFDPVVSPAISAVYSPEPSHTFRLTYSTAVRNPTLADQYLYYDVGRAILIGNLNGKDSLTTVDSFLDALNGIPNFDEDLLDYFNVAPIRPEQVQTIEAGYRGMISDKFYVDLTYYHSWYNNFIGFNIGVDADLSNAGELAGAQIYRIAANATETVTTQGINIGVNYYLGNNWVINANYSWNKLNLEGSDDPIIPAFNTPENKINVGINGRDFTLFGIRNLGCGFNFKWIEGFEFEGSPQFTGPVDTYTLLDAQVNYHWVKTNMTFKLGASNLLDNNVYQVYGGPQVGRLAYFSISYDWVNR